MSASSNDADKHTVAQVVDDDAEIGVESLTLQNFIDHQATRDFCKQALENVTYANAEFIIDKNALIVRMAPIDRAVPVAVSQAHWSRLLDHLHYLVLAAHSEQRRMYDSMLTKMYCPCMANIFYT